jgi:NitT/TauT family transport system permease protein
MDQKKTRIKKILIPVSTFILFILFGEVIVKVFDIPTITLPAPHAIALALIDNWETLILNTGITMLEAILGFLLGSAIAFGLAIVFVHSPNIRLAIYPYAVALKSTPIIAIAPLLILWFGNGLESKIVMSALVAFFPVLVNSVDGLASIEPELIDLLKSLAATKRQILYKIRIPNSLPNVFTALKISSTLSVVGAVIGEFTGASKGIGFVINTASYYLNTDIMFAAILLISLGGILFFYLINYLEKKLVFWKQI